MPGLHFLTYGNDEKTKQLKNKVDSLGVFDTVVVYSHEDLDTPFINRFKYMLASPSYTDFALWKPKIIQRRLNEIHENDFLIYLDADCEFDIDKLYVMEEYLQMLGNSEKDIITFQSDDLEECYTIQHIFDYWSLFMDKTVPKTGQFMSNILIMQNGHHLKTIMKIWYNLLLLNTNYFTNHYSSCAKKYNPNFIENRGSQSILSVICKMKGSIAIPAEYAPIINYGEIPMEICSSV